MTKEYITDKNYPSDMFIDSIDIGVGSAYMECGWCGREHFCPDSNYDPPDYGTDNNNAEWLRRCEESHRINPDGIILHYNIDGVEGKELNGVNFVIGCPCNGLSRFESFIWNERSTIRNYLKKRINREYQWAQEEKTLNTLAGFDDDKKEPFYR